MIILGNPGTKVKAFTYNKMQSSNLLPMEKSDAGCVNERLL